jgi:hypothetical protein
MPFGAGLNTDNRAAVVEDGDIILIKAGAAKA